MIYLPVKCGVNQPVLAAFWDVVKRSADVPSEARIKAQGNLSCIGPNPAFTCPLQLLLSVPNQCATTPLSAVIRVRRHGAKSVANARSQHRMLLWKKRPNGHQFRPSEHPNMERTWRLIYCKTTLWPRCLFWPQHRCTKQPGLFG